MRSIWGHSIWWRPGQQAQDEEESSLKYNEENKKKKSSQSQKRLYRNAYLWGSAVVCLSSMHQAMGSVSNTGWKIETDVYVGQ